ncbi:MAG: CBS domain-containing protein, partial [Gemmatimonadales bacterium]
MQLAEIMNPRVVTVEASAPASVAWTLMRRRRIRHLVVLDALEVVGVVSERDLGGRSGGAARRGRTVRSLMTPDIVSAAPDTPLGEAADLMRRCLIGSLPVLVDGRVVGIVTATDVLDAMERSDGLRLSQAERGLLRVPASSKRLGGTPVPRSEAPVRKRTRRAANRTKREPLASELPKTAKRTRGRTEAPLVPVAIRVAGVDVSDDVRADIRRKLGRQIGKFALSIERVTVRLSDVNGPRGGMDQQCQVKVVLSGAPSVVVESQSATMHAAIASAIA